MVNHIHAPRLSNIKSSFFSVVWGFLWFGLLGFPQSCPFMFYCLKFSCLQRVFMSEVLLCPQNSLQIQLIFSAKLKPDFQFFSGSQPIYFVSLGSMFKGSVR